MNRINNSFKIVVYCGLLTEIFYLVFLFFGESRNIHLYMFVYFETFIIFFFAYYFLIKKNTDQTSEYKSKPIKFLIEQILRFNSAQTAELKIPMIILLFGVLFRITLLPSAYTTSDDVHRYFWEGKVIVHGNNPYSAAPNDTSLINLRDENFDGVTFKHIRAIYPPLSQVVFAVTYIIAGNSQVFLKIIYLIFEFITLIFLLKLLQLKGKNSNLIFLYAWLPLPIMEYFINAHIDVIGITFLILFLYYFEKNKFNLSSIMLALVFLSKLIALLILPLVIKKLGLKKSLKFYGIFLFTTVIFYLPFFTGDLHVFDGLFRYLSRWEFNGSVYNLLKIIFSSGEISRIICGILLSATILTVSIRYKDFMTAVVAVFLSVIIFSTTVYPWYLGWISAANVFFGFASVMSLFFTINFSNLTPLAQVWKEYPIVWLIEYIPFYSLLIYELYKKRIQL